MDSVNSMMHWTTWSKTKRKKRKWKCSKKLSLPPKQKSSILPLHTMHRSRKQRKLMNQTITNRRTLKTFWGPTRSWHFQNLKAMLRSYHRFPILRVRKRMRTCGVQLKRKRARDSSSSMCLTWVSARQDGRTNLIFWTLVRRVNKLSRLQKISVPKTTFWIS